MGIAAVLLAAALAQATASAPEPAVDNPEMAALVAADQAARRSAPHID